MVELLPSAVYRLKLENEDVVLAHAAGRGDSEFCEVAAGRPGASGAFAARPDARQNCRVIDERLGSGKL